jgi:hypothetical protein
MARRSTKKVKESWLARYVHRPIKVEVVANGGSPPTWSVVVTINNPGPPINDEVQSISYDDEQRANDVADYITNLMRSYGGNVKGIERPFKPQPVSPEDRRGNSP